jgi:hypothetical protein
MSLRTRLFTAATTLAEIDAPMLAANADWAH